MNAFAFLIVLAALGFLQRAVLNRWGLKGLSYTRHFSKKKAFEGEETELIEIIRNDRLCFIPWLRAESRISPFLQFGKQEDLAVNGERYHKSVFTLRPYQQITRRHKVCLKHRGAYDVGSVSLTAGDLFGLSGRAFTLHSSAEILVYPKLLDEQRLPMPLSKFQGDLVTRRFHTQDPFCIREIREYQPGESVRFIHWPASARMGTLQMKHHDATADTKLLVVINGQLTESQWGELMDYEQALIEREISLAATVCQNALRAGMPAGFAANMPLITGDAPALFLPERHQDREEELLGAFARLRIRRCRSFLSFLDDLCFLRGTDILLLSPYSSEAIEEKLDRLRSLGNTVTLFQLGQEDENG